MSSRFAINRSARTRHVQDLAAWCAALEVPLTAHCNDSNYASPDYVGMGQPSEWMSVLANNPGLHLNLGHYGGAHVDPGGYAWADTICQNLPNYSYLYGDVGCDRIDDPATSAAYAQYLTGSAAKEPLVGSRLMLGTDWYMEALNPNAGQFLTEATDIAAQAFGAGAVSNFRGGNALRFLGFDDPSNQYNQRLTARYQRFGVAKPGWLT